MVSNEDVLRVAKLARIEIDESEIDGVQKKFSSILEHFSFLEEAKTEGVTPLFHGLEMMELRTDVPSEPIDREDLLKNAPESFEHCFKIPRILGAVE